jgi:hypothetical protein
MLHPRRRAAAPRLTRRVVALFALAGLWVGMPAAAKLCGDDVGGNDVPCACGDIVVSDVVLGDDPVSREVCPHDGLIVRAADARDGLLIDLHGRALRGSGQGAAVRVVAGGAGGARVVSSGGTARLEGFEDGVVGRGSNSVGLIEDLLIATSRRDGVRVTADDFVIRRVEVRDAGRDGFGLGGRGFQIDATRSVDSKRFGYFVMGDSGIIGRADAGNVALGSGHAGFNVMGAGHALTNCTAQGGGRVGLHLQAAQLTVRGCQAHANAGNGIEGVGNRWRLQDNLAADNRGDGIAVRGSRLADAGGNRGERNGNDEPGRPAVQCEIDGAACAL